MNHEFRSAEERRAAIVALTQKETGIDETMIESLNRASRNGSPTSATCSHSGRR